VGKPPHPGFECPTHLGLYRAPASWAGSNSKTTTINPYNLHETQNSYVGHDERIRSIARSYAHKISDGIAEVASKYNSAIVLKPRQT